MTNEPSNKNMLRHLKEYWVIYAFIAQLIATFVMNQQDHLNFTERIEKLEHYREAETVLLSDIQSRLASIETSLMFIKERVR